MPKCKKCGKHFPNNININGKKRNLQRRKYCLDCSPFGEHNTRKLHLVDDNYTGKTRKCECCKRIFAVDYKKGNKGSLCNSCRTNLRRFKIKNKCIKYKGGKCQICGYDKCNRVLIFHHRDPAKKIFGIGGAHCRSWDAIKKELDKCDLLCRNCHGELHSKNDKNLIHQYVEKNKKWQ